MDIGYLLLSLPVLPVLKNVGICAEKMGFGAYAVGGIVRDLIMQRKTVDVDIVIEGDGLAFASKFSTAYCATLKEYRRFKTARLFFGDGFKIDIATARTEVYEAPAALPVVTPGSIEDDLFRRDFSINTLAACLNPERFGHLLDPFAGIDDIKGKLIRALHEKSFTDDPTRLFRAARFEKRFHFDIEGRTEELINEALSDGILELLSGYRLASELRLVLSEEEPLPVIDRLEGLGALLSARRKAEGNSELKRLLKRIDEVKLTV